MVLNICSFDIYGFVKGFLGMGAAHIRTLSPFFLDGINYNKFDILIEKKGSSNKENTIFDPPS